MKILAVTVFVTVITLLSTTAVKADWTPVYGGGVVCPTATPRPTGIVTQPQLPKAGVEDYVFPGFVTLLTGGLYLIKKASFDSGL